MADAGVAALQRIMRAVRQLSRVPSRVAQEASGDVRRLLFEQIAAQTDPYGAAWAPHKESTLKRWGEHPVLDLTGDMIGGIDVAPSAGAGINITLGEKYSAFHQTGTRYMPARPILPDRGIPESWVSAIREASSNAFRSTLEST